MDKERPPDRRDRPYYDTSIEDLYSSAVYHSESPDSIIPTDDDLRLDGEEDSSSHHLGTLNNHPDMGTFCPEAPDDNHDQKYISTNTNPSGFASLIDLHV